MTAGNIPFLSFRAKVLALSVSLLCSAYGRSTYMTVNLQRHPTCPFTRVFGFPCCVASEVYCQMNASCPEHGVVLGISFSRNDNKWFVKCTDGLYAEGPLKVWKKIECYPKRKIPPSDVDVSVDVDL